VIDADNKNIEVNACKDWDKDDFAHAFSDTEDLIFAVGGRNFLLASPTTTKSEPELLVKEFLSVLRLRIGKIWVDGAFDMSAAFKEMCACNDITICPSAAYNHTMQAKAEGAVSICKEHVWCLLKSSNLPQRFWLWVLLQFCRSYNYWPTSTGPPPWESMTESRFHSTLTVIWCVWELHDGSLTSRTSPRQGEYDACRPSTRRRFLGLARHHAHGVDVLLQT